MSQCAELSIDGSGPRPCVVKTARTPGARSRLEHEVTVLTAAQHPGVVTLIDVEDDGEVLRVRTVFCGSRTLANHPAQPVARVAGIIAALAATVGDLHDLDIAHGRISLEHVLLGADGRPILCGFGDASIGPSAASRRSDDVFALGTLMHTLLEHHGDEVAPIPPARFGRRSSWSGYQRRALLNLADQATSDDAALRPTASQLAQNIRSTVPDATLVDADGWAHPGSHATAGERDDGSPRRLLSAAGAVVASVAIVGIASGLLALAEPPEPATPPAVESSPASANSVTTTTSPHPVASPASAPTTTMPTTSVPDDPAPDHLALGCSTTSFTEAHGTLADGRPCPVPLRYAEGVLTVSDRHYHLGLEDAALAVGAFACDGRPLAAVLDRATGELFIFDRWAGDDRSVVATSHERIDGGNRLLAEPSGDQPCHRLVVLDRYGIRHVISTMEAP